ncbi:hypothetical protein F5Y07DRAFT_72160 [Xylaria sp. FL0933]|nr:hypothetical protein F5Y07DRAFT_72160 [Xylaria sp. FL0933]
MLRHISRFSFFALPVLRGVGYSTQAINPSYDLPVPLTTKTLPTIHRNPTDLYSLPLVSINSPEASVRSWSRPRQDS